MGHVGFAVRKIEIGLARLRLKWIQLPALLAAPKVRAGLAFNEGGSDGRTPKAFASRRVTLVRHRLGVVYASVCRRRATSSAFSRLLKAEMRI
jgi:hypothetical protein